MRILITNDDGMEAKQLIPLIRWCQKLGKVTTVVPKIEQSGKSHGIELRHAFEAKPVKLAQDIDAWAVDSTPADCVRFAVMGLHMEFDLVISGVNRGYNIGTDVMYSGTVAAVFEAANLGLPAVALSTSPGNYDRATEHLDLVLKYFTAHQLMEKGSHYNVNIPPEPKGIRITRQGGPFYTDDFPHIGNDLYEPKGVCIYENRNDLTLDTDSVMSGFISIMPVTTDRTDSTLYAQLAKLNND